MRRFSLLPLTLMALSGFLCRRPALAQGLVVTPNCIQPLDTLKVKSGGWPKQEVYVLAHSPCFPGGPLTCISIFRTSNSVVEWTLYDEGRAFIYRDESWWHADESEIGDYYLRVYQGPIGATGTRCIWIPYRVVADIGNPWNLVVRPCSNPTAPACRPTIEMRFDPALWCNTSACSKIRIVQAYRDSAVCGTGCFRILTNAEQGLRDGVARDQTTVAGWTIDAVGDDPSTPQVNEEERDPYMNGNDRKDMQFTGHRVGEQGGVTKVALVRDRPQTTLPGEPPADVTEFVTTFEINAFCSDGPIQGEWLGRAVWRWNKPRGGAATIAILSTTREQPSQQFMDALRGWTQARGFEWPRDDAVPTRGGVKCGPGP